VRQRVVITDLTRMREGRVCLAGYPLAGQDVAGCVRPEFRYGALTEAWLYAGDEALVRPFAVVELDLQEHRPHPPHTEDWIVDARYRGRSGLLAPAQRLALLAQLDDGGCERIFGAPIHEDHGWFIHGGEGSRSLGTVRPDGVVGVLYAPRPPHGWDYRLAFRDATGDFYNLSVTDLAFRYYLDSLRQAEDLTPRQGADHLLATLREADHLYLRLGLARGWGDHPDRCHLQITAVYTFADYLGGRCFADLSPTPPARYDPSEVPF
jgi:hypothetical protein